MPSVHDWAKSLATKLINKHGRTAQLVTLVEDEAQPWDEPDAGASETTHDVIVVQTAFTAQERDSDLIEDHDRCYLMDSKVAPNIAMRLRDGASDLSIINVDTLQPGPDVIRYKVQARL